MERVGTLWKTEGRSERNDDGRMSEELKPKDGRLRQDGEVWDWGKNVAESAGLGRQELGQQEGSCDRQR